MNNHTKIIEKKINNYEHKMVKLDENVKSMY